MNIKTFIAAAVISLTAACAEQPAAQEDQTTVVDVPEEGAAAEAKTAS